MSGSCLALALLPQFSILSTSVLSTSVLSSSSSPALFSHLFISQLCSWVELRCPASLSLSQAIKHSSEAFNTAVTWWVCLCFIDTMRQLKSTRVLKWSVFTRAWWRSAKKTKKKHINKRDETPSVDSDLASTLPMIHFNSGGSYIRENRVLWRLKKCLGFYESFHNRLTDDLQRRWQNKPTLRVLDFVEINCSSAALWATLLQTHDVSVGCYSLAVSSPLSLHPTPRNEHVSHKLLNSFHSVLLLFHCCFFALYQRLKKRKTSQQEIDGLLYTWRNHHWSQTSRCSQKTSSAVLSSVIILQFCLQKQLS